MHVEDLSGKVLWFLKNTHTHTPSKNTFNFAFMLSFKFLKFYKYSKVRNKCCFLLWIQASLFQIIQSSGQQSEHIKSAG